MSDERPKSTDSNNVASEGERTTIFTKVATNSFISKHKFEELEVVRLAVPKTEDGTVFPRKTPGTVVAVYERALAYEVEVSTPHFAVITTEEAELEKLTAADLAALLTQSKVSQPW